MGQSLQLDTKEFIHKLFEHLNLLTNVNLDLITICMDHCTFIICTFNCLLKKKLKIKTFNYKKQTALCKRRVDQSVCAQLKDVNKCLR